jgi:hypothetical protein
MLKARGLPFHQQTIQRLESGERPVRLNEAYVIAGVLDLDLVSMTTASPSASARELRYAIDRFRRESGGALGALQENVADWLQEFAGVTAELSDLLRAGPASPSPELAWAAAWVRRGASVLRNYMNFAASFAVIGASSLDWVDELSQADEQMLAEAEGQLVRADAILAERHPGLTSRALGDIEPATLYQLFTTPGQVAAQLPISGWIASAEAQSAVVRFFEAAGHGEHPEAP